MFGVFDGIILASCEYCKTLLSEVYILLGQIFNTIFMIILFIFFDIKQFFSVGIREINVITDRVRSSLNDILSDVFESDNSKNTEGDHKKSTSSSPTKNTASSDESDAGVSIEEYLSSKKKRGGGIVNFVKRLLNLCIKSVLLIPHLLLQNSSFFRRNKRDRCSSNSHLNKKIKYEEKKATGLIEEIYLKSLEFIDVVGESWILLFRFRLISAVKKLWSGVCLFSINSLTSTKGFDERTIHQVIMDEDFPGEKHKIVTQDGYHLELERIVNRKSKKIVFFQHGILDSSYCWVQNNNSQSLAFRCHQRGYDIYLGNFRGFGGKMEHEEKNIGSKYWDYTIDSLIEHDMVSFFEKVIEIKRRELGDVNPEDLDITLCAHSLGGGVSIGYIVNQIAKNRKHHLSRAILLSPAGIHPSVHWFMQFLRGLVMFLNFVNIKYLGINNQKLRILFIKLFYDVAKKKGSSSILYVLSSIATGGYSQNMAEIRWENLINHVFFGTSSKLMNQFAQLAAHKNEFYAYDHGKKENLKRYGSEVPFCYSKHYKEVDIPISFVAADVDTVIDPICVKAHFDKLKENKNVAHKMKIFKGYGHMDMTYNILEDIVQYVEECIYDEK